ncbi:MAG: hypothetical protein J3K34DRAFT_187703 [Monoraphidium minutum]|nr:MAG: hypothetical protein J3K34DRAFT_187703 [Monoraphidium minutum]
MTSGEVQCLKESASKSADRVAATWGSSGCGAAHTRATRRGRHGAPAPAPMAPGPGVWGAARGGAQRMCPPGAACGGWQPCKGAAVRRARQGGGASVASMGARRSSAGLLRGASIGLHLKGNAGRVPQITAGDWERSRAKAKQGPQGDGAGKRVRQGETGRVRCAGALGSGGGQRRGGRG